MKIFRPEDFGAIANGIHNDAIAIWKTLAAAIEYDGEAQVLLEANKTYRFGPTEDQKCGKHQMLIGGLRQNPASMNCTAPISSWNKARMLSSSISTQPTSGFSLKS